MSNRRDGPQCKTDAALTEPWIDVLGKALAGGIPRRTALKLLVGSALGGVFGITAGCGSGSTTLTPTPSGGNSIPAYCPASGPCQQCTIGAGTTSCTTCHDLDTLCGSAASYDPYNKLYNYLVGQGFRAQEVAGAPGKRDVREYHLIQASNLDTRTLGLSFTNPADAHLTATLFYLQKHLPFSQQRASAVIFQDVTAISSILHVGVNSQIAIDKPPPGGSTRPTTSASHLPADLTPGCSETCGYICSLGSQGLRDDCIGYIQANCNGEPDCLFLGYVVCLGTAVACPDICKGIFCTCGVGCGECFTCVDGTCITIACDQGQTCCQGSGCVDLTKNPQLCNSCCQQNGRVCSTCEDGTCVDNDIHCPSCQVCKNGVCVDKLCGDCQKCQDGSCVSTCSAGECCVLMPNESGGYTAACMATCPSSEVCCNGTCRPAGTTTCGDACCDPGFICCNGACIPQQHAQLVRATPRNTVPPVHDACPAPYLTCNYPGGPICCVADSFCCGFPSQIATCCLQGDVCCPDYTSPWCCPANQACHKVGDNAYCIACPTG